MLQYVFFIHFWQEDQACATCLILACSKHAVDKHVSHILLIITQLGWVPAESHQATSKNGTNCLPAWHTGIGCASLAELFKIKLE